MTLLIRYSYHNTITNKVVNVTINNKIEYYTSSSNQYLS